MKEKKSRLTCVTLEGVNAQVIEVETTFTKGLPSFYVVGLASSDTCCNLLSKMKSCRCSEIEIKHYKNKLSDPFLDRIDLFVVMQEVNSSDKGDMTSSQMHEEVIKAFKMQKKEGKKD
jgi:magnesium chelatase family protein